MSRVDADKIWKDARRAIFASSTAETDADGWITPDDIRRDFESLEVIPGETASLTQQRDFSGSEYAAVPYSMFGGSIMRVGHIEAVAGDTVSLTHDDPSLSVGSLELYDSKELQHDGSLRVIGPRVKGIVQFDFGEPGGTAVVVHLSVPIDPDVTIRAAEAALVAAAYDIIRGMADAFRSSDLQPIER